MNAGRCLACVVCTTCLVFACGDNSIEGPPAADSGAMDAQAVADSATSDASTVADSGGNDAQTVEDSGTSPFPFACEGSVEDISNGLQRCRPGYQRRVGPSVCPSSVPRAMTIQSYRPEDECEHDEDCSELHLGHCATREGGSANVCVEGCTQDSDCTDERVCLCGDPVGRCVPADCKTGDDCGPGYSCVLNDSEPLCFSPRFACQTPQDECGGELGCELFSVNATFCVYNEDHFACTTSQCTTP